MLKMRKKKKLSSALHLICSTSKNSVWISVCFVWNTIFWQFHFFHFFSLKIFTYQNEKDLVVYILKCAAHSNGLSITDIRKMAFEFGQKVKAKMPERWVQNRTAVLWIHATPSYDSAFCIKMLWPQSTSQPWISKQPSQSAPMSLQPSTYTSTQKHRQNHHTSKWSNCVQCKKKTRNKCKRSIHKNKQNWRTTFLCAGSLFLTMSKMFQNSIRLNISLFN